MTTFKYNLSFYYQSTIIYFVVFVLYVVIRGEFVEDSFTLITKDPIIYFFGIIVLISIIGLLYNIYKQKHIEINHNGISFVSRAGKRSFSINEISWVKLTKERGKKAPLRIVRIKLKHRKRPVLIRPHDYENSSEFIQRLQELKTEIEKNK